MAESEEHRALVGLLRRTVCQRFEAYEGLCVYWDDSDTPHGSRPRAIDGFVPDLLAVSVPPLFTVLGEAKSTRDLRTRRSHAQLRCFLRYLANSPAPKLILAVPPATAAYAQHLLRAMKAQEGAGLVGTEILTPVGSF